MQNSKYNKVIAICISIFILSFSILLIIQKKQLFSENENRYLEKFPTFSFEKIENGKYMQAFDNYLADHFPFRNSYMSIKTNIEKLLGKKDINGVYYAKKGYLIEKYETPTHTNQIIDTLNTFQKTLNYTNMNLMLVPTSISVNQDLLPFETQNKQLDTLNTIYQNVHLNTISLIDTLKEHNKTYPMYYKTDHHWTSYGAYYAYLEYCKENHIKPLDITDFELEEATNQFYGTLYSKVVDNTLKSDTIHLFLLKNSKYTVEYIATNKKTDTLYDREYLNQKDKYSVFLSNNHPLIVVTNENIKNNQQLVVIKDSYANSLIPFLIEHYQKIHIIDPRYYKLSIPDYIKKENIQDVLFVYNMNTIDRDTGILSIN